MMLFEELNKIKKRIEAIESIKDARGFLEEMIRNRASTVVNLKKKPVSPGRDLILFSIAFGCISKLIMPLPGLIEKMTTVINALNTPLAEKCSLADALAYLIKADDMMPDTARGGYGFVDDSVLLHAAWAEYLKAENGDMTELNRCTDIAMVAAGICPENIADSLDSAIRGIGLAFQVYSNMPGHLLLKVLNKVLTDPYGAPPPIEMPSANSPEKDPFLTPNASVSTNVQSVTPQNNERVWTPQVSVRNSLNMSLTSGGGIIAATFPDGRSVILGS